jgi:hypothetical protein
MNVSGASTTGINYADCRSRTKNFLRRWGKIIPAGQGNATHVNKTQQRKRPNAKSETYALVRSLKPLHEAEDSVNTLSLQQAAKLLTLSNLGLLSYVPELPQLHGKSRLETSQEVDTAYSILVGQATDVPEADISTELARWNQALRSSDAAAVKTVEDLGFQIQISGPISGNTGRIIDPYDTDMTLNRGDFTAPSFNG